MAALGAIVLGAAAGGGLPQWNCNAPNSRALWEGRAPFPPATQSSLAVGTGDGVWAVLNASPDLRAQIMATPALQPRDPGRRGLRDSPIAAVLATNGDIDHVAGLLSLREGHAFRLVATPAIHRILAANPVFEALPADRVPRVEVRPGETVALLPGLDAAVFSVPGKVPLYMEDGAVETGREGEETVGVELAAGGRRLVYVPGCAAMTEALAARLDGADLVLFDGTVYHDDEMIRAGVGAKTGRRMGHMPMAGPGGSLEAFSGLRVGRKVYVHINNTNPVWWPDSPERAAVAAAGWEIAHDGMELTP